MMDKLFAACMILACIALALLIIILIVHPIEIISEWIDERRW